MHLTKKQKTAVIAVAIAAILCLIGAVIAVLLSSGSKADKPGGDDTHPAIQFADPKQGAIAGYLVDQETVAFDEDARITAGMIASADILFQDAETGEEVPADVTVYPDGYFEAVLPEGNYTVTVRAPGYEPYTWPEPVEVRPKKIHDFKDPIKLIETESAGYGNVAASGGYLYFWKYHADTYSSEPGIFGYYQYNPDTVNRLVRRDAKGNETTVLTANGVNEICIANGRIFYQVVPPGEEYAQKLSVRSCAPDGSDIREHTVGVLRGLIDGGKHLIVEERTETPYRVISIDTKTLETKELSTDHFLICGEHSVFFTRSNANSIASRYDEEDTVYEVDGVGQFLRDLHTERADTLPSIADNKQYNKTSYSGGVTFSGPMVTINTLFYIFEHIDGSASMTQSARIMRIDLETGAASEIRGDVENGNGEIYSTGIEVTDEASQKYNDYLCDEDHINVLKKEDYADFSGADFTDSGTDLLKVVYCEYIGDTAYVLLTHGTFTETMGWRSLYRFEKCALFEKNTATGKVKLFYDSSKPEETPSAEGETEAPAAAKLTEEELVTLFNKANTFYIGWLEHGPHLSEDESMKLVTEKNVYYPVDDNTYASIDEITAAAASMFDESIYTSRIESFYTMYNGILYGVIGCGEGGDVGPESYTLEIVSQTDTACTFRITANYPYGNGSYTVDCELSYTNGRWIFVNQFYSIWAFSSLME